jgi:hypothetical protein
LVSNKVKGSFIYSNWRWSWNDNPDQTWQWNELFDLCIVSFVLDHLASEFDFHPHSCIHFVLDECTEYLISFKEVRSDQEEIARKYKTPQNINSYEFKFVHYSNLIYGININIFLFLLLLLLLWSNVIRGTKVLV